MHWRLRGYDGTHLLFEKIVPFGQFTNVQIRDLLRALTAKAGLTNDEILGAYAKRGTTIANDLLLVRKELRDPTFYCGSNPHFTASVVDNNGKILRRRLREHLAHAVRAPRS